MSRWSSPGAPAEPPGVGGVGQAFVDAVRAQAAPRSVNVYPVNYPASSDFMDRIAFARTVVDGIRDAGLHIEATAANCPDTRIVLGGFSQGAALAGYVTSAEIPEQVPGRVPRVHPESDALGGGRPRRGRGPDRTAVAGILERVPAHRPSRSARRTSTRPSRCAHPTTPSATVHPPGPPSFAHAMYGVNGGTNDAAAYAVARLNPASNPPPAPVPGPGGGPSAGAMMVANRSAISSAGPPGTV